MKPKRPASQTCGTTAASYSENRKAGFVLIVTLAMLILITVIAVGLISLSSVTLRSAGRGEAMRTAQSNARLALQIALGELQSTMGPDTRVSANAAILDGRQSVDPTRRFVTGVWNAWNIDPGNIGGYESRKAGSPSFYTSPTGTPNPQGGFYRWLVSSRNDSATKSLGFAAAPAVNHPVTLVPALGQNLPAVTADTVPLNENKKETGRYAWVVLDEGQKAPLNAYGKPIAPNPHTKIETLNRQPDLAWGNVQDWTAINQVPRDDRLKLISSQTLDFLHLQDAGKSFHGITPGTSSVLSNVIDGGLKTDLSLLFQDQALPAEFADRHLYSNTDTPLVGKPPRAGHPYELPSPDPKWKILHNYYRLPIDVYDPLDPKINFDAKQASATIPSRLQNLQTNPGYHDAVKLAPVISKAQFIFSLSFAAGNTLTGGAARNGIWRKERGKNVWLDDSRWKTEAFLVIDPIITLWNPFDVPIVMKAHGGNPQVFCVLLHRMPLEFRFENTNNPNYRNPPAGRYTPFNQIIGGDGSMDTAHPYPLVICPEIGRQEIVLLPGEHRVFSVQDYKTTFNLANQGRQTVIMRPGWYPPGNKVAPERVGGIVSPDYNYGAGVMPDEESHTYRGIFESTRTVVLGAGDQLSVGVRATGTQGSSSATYATLGGQSCDFYLRYGAWIDASMLTGKASEQVQLADFGAIELNYGNALTDRNLFPEYQSGGELPFYPVAQNDITDAYDWAVVGSSRRNEGDGSNYPFAPTKRGVANKKPFLIATLHLKDLVATNSTAKYPAKAWLHNNPANFYASAEIGGTQISPSAHQYEFSYRPLQGSWNEEAPEITGDRHLGFGGPAPDAQNGRNYAPSVSLPRARLTSLAQFRHAPVNQSGKQPLQAQVVANSHAHPLLQADEVLNTRDFHLDHSFLANQTLFDTSFLSTALNTGDFIGFLVGNMPLVESRFTPVSVGSLTEVNSVLGTGNSNQAYRKSGAYLMMDGGFNVNSTSVDAWLAFLSGINHGEIPHLADFLNSEIIDLDNPVREPLFTRYQLPLEESLGGKLDPLASQVDPFAWRGYHRLGQSQLRDLAERIVEQVKLRGPFQSLSEFINRRAEDSELGRLGCLDAAIEATDINEEAGNVEHIAISGNEAGSESYGYPAAAAGNSLTGTPGHLLQGDLLQTTAPYINVRSDTFRIRTYGAATDGNGRVIAEAWCECIVQRYPEFVDPTNEPYEFLDASGQSQLTPANEKFGRRFNIISFRWLENPSTPAS